jgi:hypothetical protein
MSDDEPPPLEDMKDYLISKGLEIPVQSRPVPPPAKVSEASQPAPFAPGMKKGFFNQSKPSKKPVKKEELVTIKPTKAKENPLVLKEVQEVMQYTNQHTEEWLTPELIQRLAQHPFLAAGMTNPRLMSAVTELQKDPSLAATKYKYDQEVQIFFNEFSKVMADHFGRLADKKQKSFDGDEEVAEILKDRNVSKVLKALQKGKPVDFHQ